MRKIRIIEHISLDGVIQAPGGPDEDRDGGFKYGGWAFPHSDPAVGEAIMAAMFQTAPEPLTPDPSPHHSLGRGESDAAHAEPFDLLLGRRTYDIWAGYWPNHGDNPIGKAFNKATKYVATHRPESLGWGPAEDLGVDIVEGLRRIKSKDGADLIVWGSSTLAPVLLGNGLADEVLLLVYPVLLGTGKRFFSEGADPRELALFSTKAASSGVLMNTYRPVGSLRTGSFAEASR